MSFLAPLLVMLTVASLALAQFAVGLVCAARYPRTRVPATGLILVAVITWFGTLSLPYQLCALAHNPGRLPAYSAVVIGWVAVSAVCGVWIAVGVSAGRTPRPVPNETT